MRLSEYFGTQALLRDGDFEVLGHVMSRQSGTLVYCDSIRYIRLANENANATCVITNESLAGYVAPAKGLIVEASPKASYYLLHQELFKKGLGVYRVKGKIGEDCRIHPTASISEHCSIGNGVTINAYAVIGDGVTIGDHAFVDAGVIIGSEGLLTFLHHGVEEAVRHGGGVVIGDHVTLLSHVVVAKSIHPSQLTEIGDHSIVGVASTIGHDAVLGANCVISGNCVIARGAQVGHGAYIGASSVVREYVRLGERAQVKVGSIVVEDVEGGKAVSGNFAIPHNKHLLQFSRTKR